MMNFCLYCKPFRTQQVFQGKVVSEEVLVCPLFTCSFLRKLWFLLPFQWSWYQWAAVICCCEACTTGAFLGLK